MRNGSRATRLRFFVLAAFAAVVGLASTSAAGAEDRGVDPNQGESLVEVTVSSKAAATRLQLQADSYGIDFNEHYLRKNSNGTVTVTVFGSENELNALEAAGYEIGVTIEGPATWRERMADRQATIRAEERSEAAALGDPVTEATHENEVVILRADYFENYAGRFLSVEAKTRLGRALPGGAAGFGYDPSSPTLSLSWNTGAGTPISTTPRVMDTNIDPDTTPDTYIEHRELVRIGEPGTTTPARPTRIRVGSSTGATIEGDVSVWLGGGLPPRAAGFLSDFTTRYMDPTEVYGRFNALAAEFPNIAQLIPLPYKTNGYQRKSQATLAKATTTLSVAAAAGATGIRVASTNGLVAGNAIVVDTGANQEVRRIATIPSPAPASPNPNVTF